MDCLLLLLIEDIEVREVVRLFQLALNLLIEHLHAIFEDVEAWSQLFRIKAELRPFVLSVPVNLVNPLALVLVLIDVVLSGLLADGACDLI